MRYPKILRSLVHRVAVPVLVLAAAPAAIAQQQLYYLLGQAYYRSYQADWAIVDVAGGADCKYVLRDGGTCFGAGRTGSGVSLNLGATAECTGNVMLCANLPGNFGTSDFMISFSINTNQPDPVVLLLSNIYDNCDERGSGGKWQILKKQGRVVVELTELNVPSLSDWAILRVLGTTVVDDGHWHDISVVRTGLTVTLFVDGVADGSATPVVHSTNLPYENVMNVSTSSGYTSAGAAWGEYCAPFKGYMDELIMSSK